VKDFRRLEVWQKAHRLSLAIYRATAIFPNEEKFGLTSQIRRCCVSIEANSAEGCGRFWRSGSAPIPLHRAGLSFWTRLRIAPGSWSWLPDARQSWEIVQWTKIYQGDAVDLHPKNRNG